MADGTTLLSSELARRRRKRYLEVYKRRLVNYVPGRYLIEITKQRQEGF